MSKSLDELLQVRRNKLEALREQGNAFPNDFRPNVSIGMLVRAYLDHDQDKLDEANEHWKQETGSIRIAGRIKLHRVMGKTSFAQIYDHSGMIQLYLRRNNEETDGNVPRSQYNAFKKWDLGDIVGAEGFLYRTQKGELSIRVTNIRLLTKSLQPLPDKHHGLADQEARYRQRYLDLMSNSDSMAVFKARSQIISQIRHFMEESEFIEVETPMMHPIPGGASARPFITHHNALDMGLYLRIAPELYLKRLIVGGFTKVFEINRNFRNEGLSPRHNPEFTMMEFYWAYADYNDLISFTERMLKWLVDFIGHKIIFNGEEIDFSRFERMTMEEAVQQYLLKDSAHVTESYETLKNWVDSCYFDPVSGELDTPDLPETKGGLIAYLFEEHVEHRLIQPTFITKFPVEISPLARRNDANSEVADRFELFIAGQEIANGFSELNDPDDQAARFREQVDAMAKGDDEAMHYDADYIRALEYGMAPTAGEGIGIDRLLTILLNQSNIRDVLLFPQMKPKGG